MERIWCNFNTWLSTLPDRLGKETLIREAANMGSQLQWESVDKKLISCVLHISCFCGRGKKIKQLKALFKVSHVGVGQHVEEGAFVRLDQITFCEAALP